MFCRFVKGKKHILKMYKLFLEKTLQNEGFIIKIILCSLIKGDFLQLNKLNNS